MLFWPSAWLYSLSIIWCISASFFCETFPACQICSHLFTMHIYWAPSECRHGEYSLCPHKASESSRREAVARQSCKQEEWCEVFWRTGTRYSKTPSHLLGGGREGLWRWHLNWDLKSEEQLARQRRDAHHCAPIEPRPSFHIIRPSLPFITLFFHLYLSSTHDLLALFLVWGI